MKKLLAKSLCMLAFTSVMSSCTEKTNEIVTTNNLKNISVNKEFGTVIQQISDDTYYVADFKVQTLQKVSILNPMTNYATTLPVSETKFADIKDPSDLAKVEELRKYSPVVATTTAKPAAAKPAVK